MKGIQKTAEALGLLCLEETGNNPREFKVEIKPGVFARVRVEIKRESASKQGILHYDNVTVVDLTEPGR